MSRVLLFSLIVFSTELTAQTPSTTTEAHFKALTWLVGNWERTNVKPGNSGNERWQFEGPYKLKGLGVTLRGSDTAFVEKIEILIKDDKLYYVADVIENSEPVYFEMSSIARDGFVCENPEHDFPKKIEYKRTGSNLSVLISAGSKSQSYLFIRH